MLVYRFGYEMYPQVRNSKPLESEEGWLECSERQSNSCLTVRVFGLQRKEIGAQGSHCIAISGQLTGKQTNPPLISLEESRDWSLAAYRSGCEFPTRPEF